MARMYPELTEDQLLETKSNAEIKVYRAFRDQVPHDYLVLFQVGWILRQELEQARDGEADFLVCHPEHGFICIEVKGGGIEFNAMSAEWQSIDRHGIRHSIKNPIQQALKGKYSITQKLSEQKEWIALGLRNVVRGHAVIFPDVNLSDLPDRPDLPKVLMGSSAFLAEPKRWIEAAFTFWKSNSADSTPLGRNGIAIIQNIFARSFKAMPLISLRLEEQEQRRIDLTRDQIRVLDLLRSHRRAAVVGGAGTGKTVLAVEKARRLASEGFRTLLTCYNRQLADHLAALCQSTHNLDVMGFHQLCHHFSEQAKRQSGRDLLGEAKLTYPGQDLFDIQLPNALAYSLDILPNRYDAIVCDEGQDFREEFWLSIELLLSDFESSPLYVFYDDNQNLYSIASTFPIRDQPFCLTTNCRNTLPIHNGAYRYYKGYPVNPPDIPGDDILYDATSPKQQAQSIRTKILNLLLHQGVRPSDITVLVADAINKSHYYNALAQLPLTRTSGWDVEGHRTPDHVLIDTIQRFKGLESPIIFLWGFDSMNADVKQELLYVGMSRAKSLLYIVASPEICERLVGRS